MDGRDIGTVVLPQRRGKGLPYRRTRRPGPAAACWNCSSGDRRRSWTTVLRDIVQRDEQDRNRAVAPLRQAEDAVLVDTTELGPGGEPEGPDLTLVKGAGWHQ